MLALATCNSPIHGHDVLPWGGRDGRLGTNPIAYAVPTGGDPVRGGLFDVGRARGQDPVLPQRGEEAFRTAGSSTRTATPRTTRMRSTARRAGAFCRWVPLRGTRDLPSVCSLKSSAARWRASAQKTHKRSGTASASLSLIPSAFLPARTVPAARRRNCGLHQVVTARTRIRGGSWFQASSNSARSGSGRSTAFQSIAATLEAMREHGARLGVSVDGFLNPEGEE